MTTTKKDIYPKKPTTKRDKHYYEIGFEQGVRFPAREINVTTKLNDNEWEDFYNVSSRKDFGDTEKPFYYHVRSKAIVTGLLIIAGIIAWLFVMAGDQEVIKVGLIH